MMKVPSFLTLKEKHWHKEGNEKPRMWVSCSH